MLDQRIERYCHECRKQTTFAHYHVGDILGRESGKIVLACYMCTTDGCANKIYPALTVVMRE